VLWGHREQGGLSGASVSPLRLRWDRRGSWTSAMRQQKRGVRAGRHAAPCIRDRAGSLVTVDSAWLQQVACYGCMQVAA
jgi:hypothetical protein